MEEVQNYGGNHEAVGSGVIYTDPVGKRHKALITAVWGRGPEALGRNPINIVYVIDDPARNDPYGRQMERATSVSPKDGYSAHGRFYELIANVVAD